jgi:putative heme-binding domain-containing protein
MRFVALFVLLSGIARPQDPLANASPADIARGKRLFRTNCAGCHGIDAAGGSGPSLLRAKMKRAPDNAALIEVIISGIGTAGMPSSWHLLPDGPKQIAAYIRSLTAVNEPPTPGDARNGQAVFGRSGCSSCHVVAGHGEGIGPELTDIGLRRPAASLRNALTKPDTAATESYLVVTVRPTSGDAVRGLRLNEDSFTIQVKDAGGAFHSFRKLDVVRIDREGDKSFMPSFARLPDSDLQDLIAYLSSLRGEL